MERRAFELGFALAFSGVMLLAVGWQAAAARPQPERATEGAALVRATASPETGSRWGSWSTTAPSVSESIAQSSASPSPFGRLMPDGSYCGINCPDEEDGY